MCKGRRRRTDIWKLFAIAINTLAVGLEPFTRAINIIAVGLKLIR